MKRFKFRLQRVLDYRQRIRSEKLQVLRQRNFERDTAIERLDSLRAESLRLNLPTGSIMTVSELTMIGAYASRIKSEIAQQQERVIEVTKVAEAALQDYVESSKESRALELLKDKRQIEYNEYVLKEEEKLIDEQTIQRIGQKKAFGTSLKSPELPE